LHNNNNNNEKNKSAKDESDEIIEILNNYRKKNGEPTKKEEELVTKPVDKTIKTIINKPDEQTIENEIVHSEVPQPIIYHFAENEQGEKVVENLNPHLSDNVNIEDLKNVVNKSERFQKEKKPGKKFFITLGNTSFLFKALFYIFFVLVISAYLSYYVIAIGNDVFALVKEKPNVIISIEEGATIDQVTDELVKQDLIEFGWIFKLYLKYRSDEEYKFIAGDHTIDETLNYTQLIDKLTKKYKERVSVRIVIPEGLTVDQIIDLFLEKGIGTREGFVDAINNYEYDWEFVKELEVLGYPDRKYRLEGYLFPDTYDFYIDTNEVMVINRLLNNFDDKFWNDYKTDYLDKCNEYGMTFDDIITLASMVEAEGNNALDFEYISYVFHNRLDNAGEHPEFAVLESDATIQYVLPERREDLTQSDLDLDNPYNTYKYKGLPPGAICNPGLDAISAALYPSKPVDSNDHEINAFFFVSNKAGKTYYAMTNNGHEKNKDQVDVDNAAIEAGTYNG